MRSKRMELTATGFARPPQSDQQAVGKSAHASERNGDSEMDSGYDGLVRLVKEVLTEVRAARVDLKKQIKSLEMLQAMRQAT